MKMPKSTNKLYGNCQVFSPDGILMFRCDAKKANWYLDRDLAIKLNEEPLTVQLTFEPRGLGNSNRPYGLIELENKCVKCGTEHDLTRHHVVPSCYRRFFPENYKTHNHHDVLSLCVDCHDTYERYADELKGKFAIEYNAPIDGEWDDIDDIKFRIAKNAITLQRHGDVMPLEKKEKLTNELVELLGNADYDLDELTDMPKPELKKTHGEMVVERLESIDDFVICWRKHFVETFNPPYLPENWDINNVTKLK